MGALASSQEAEAVTGAEEQSGSFLT